MVKLVTIDWYRHALSCANVMHDKGAAGAVGQIFLRDPDLTIKGFEQAKATGKCVEKLAEHYDLICCSRMCRAIETAIGIFGDKLGDKNIHVLPYISEKRRPFGVDRQNAPQEESVAITQVEKFLDTVKVNFNVRTQLKWETDSKWPKDYDEPNSDYFYNYVLPKLVHDIFVVKHRFRKAGDTDKVNVRLAIVSHGRFIRETLEIRKCFKDLVCKSQNEPLLHAQNVTTSPKCEFNPLPDSNYVNANTSCWRETREFDCILGGCSILKRTRIDLVYSPNPEEEPFNDTITKKDVENCDASVQSLAEDSMSPSRHMGLTFSTRP